MEANSSNKCQSKYFENSEENIHVDIELKGLSMANCTSEDLSLFAAVLRNANSEIFRLKLF